MVKEIIVERYDEENGIIRLPLSKAIKEELKIYEEFLKTVLRDKKLCSRMEHLRRWRISKDNDIIIRLVIEENKKK